MYEDRFDLLAERSFLKLHPSLHNLSPVYTVPTSSLAGHSLLVCVPLLDAVILLGWSANPTHRIQSLLARARAVILCRDNVSHLSDGGQHARAHCTNIQRL